MKTLQLSVSITLMVLASLFAFTSCEDDDDRWATGVLEGEWIITDVLPRYGECPYRYGDIIYFFANGRLRAFDHSGDLDEEGYWEVRHGYLYIDFDLDGRDDLVATIRELDYGYLELGVTDYIYESKYSLRIVRD